jgi:hypothetical protein
MLPNRRAIAPRWPFGSPQLRRLASLHLVIVAAIALLGNRRDRGINHLAGTRNVALGLQMLANVVPSGMPSSMPSPRNRVNDSRSRT